MAFASTVTRVVRLGPKKIAFGTFTNTSTDSGGEIATGLSYVDFFIPSVSSHLATENIKHTKNSASAGGVTIVTSEGADGDWLAIGT